MKFVLTLLLLTVYSQESRAFFINDILQNFSDILSNVNNSVSAKDLCPEKFKKPKEKKVKNKSKKKRNSPKQKLTKKRDVSSFAKNCLGSDSPDTFQGSISS